METLNNFITEIIINSNDAKTKEYQEFKNKNLNNIFKKVLCENPFEIEDFRKILKINNFIENKKKVITFMEGIFYHDLDIKNFYNDYNSCYFIVSIQMIIQMPILYNNIMSHEPTFFHLNNTVFENAESIISVFKIIFNNYLSATAKFSLQKEKEQCIPFFPKEAITLRGFGDTTEIIVHLYDNLLDLFKINEYYNFTIFTDEVKVIDGTPTNIKVRIIKNILNITLDDNLEEKIKEIKFINQNLISYFTIDNNRENHIKEYLMSEILTIDKINFKLKCFCYYTGGHFSFYLNQKGKYYHLDSIGSSFKPIEINFDNYSKARNHSRIYIYERQEIFDYNLIKS